MEGTCKIHTEKFRFTGFYLPIFTFNFILHRSNTDMLTLILCMTFSNYFKNRPCLLGLNWVSWSCCEYHFMQSLRQSSQTSTTSFKILKAVLPLVLLYHFHFLSEAHFSYFYLFRSYFSVQHCLRFLLLNPVLRITLIFWPFFKQTPINPMVRRRSCPVLSPPERPSWFQTVTYSF